MYSNAILQAIADELSESSCSESIEYRIKGTTNSDQVTIISEHIDYSSFAPETTRILAFKGPRCTAFDILCGKVNGRA